MPEIVATSPSPLTPFELSDAATQAVYELLREAQSANTVASYRAALRYWAAWFALRYGTGLTLPVSRHVVVQFIVDHAQRMTENGLRTELPPLIDKALVDSGVKAKLGPMALSTLTHRVAVLSKAHQVRSLTNACQDPEVRELMSGTRRAYGKRGNLPRKKDALTERPSGGGAGDVR